MQTFRNLVPDSALVQETITLLRAYGGRASTADVAEAVLQLPALEPSFATTLISELIRDDWRVGAA